MFLLLPQHFILFENSLLVSGGCYINIAGRKPVSREISDVAMFFVSSVLHVVPGFTLAVFAFATGKKLICATCEFYLLEIMALIVCLLISYSEDSDLSGQVFN
jgi:hypothetical protein